MRNHHFIGSRYLQAYKYLQSLCPPAAHKGTGSGYHSSEMLESPPNSLDGSLDSPDGGRYRGEDGRPSAMAPFSAKDMPTPLITAGLTPPSIGGGSGMFGFSSYEYNKKMNKILEGATGQHRESIQSLIDEKREETESGSTRHPEFNQKFEAFKSGLDQYKDKKAYLKAEEEQLRLAAAKPMHDKLIMDIELLKHKLLAASYGSHGADIKELFDHYDKERHHHTLKGSLENEHIRTIILDIVPGCKEAELRAFLHILDPQDRGYVTKAEFIKFVSDRSAAHDEESYGKIIDRFASIDLDLPSPQPLKLAVTPAQQQAHAHRMAKPFERHVWKGVSEKGVDYKVTTNHKGRQRPAPKQPLSVKKEKMEKEYGLGYVDPEKEAWEKLKAGMMKAPLEEEEVPKEIIWTDSLIKRNEESEVRTKKFKVSLSDFDKWLKKNRQWTDRAKENHEKLVATTKSEAEYVSPTFAAAKTPVLAERAYDRYRAAIIQEGGERGELMGGREEGSMESVDEDGDLGVSAFTEEGVSPGPRTEDTFRDRQVRNLLEVVPFEVLPVHERLHQEARLSKKKYDRKMESEGLVGKPAIEPPKVLRKSKQILSLSPNKRESLVNKEKELSRSNISLRFESPRGMRRTQDPEKPLELDRELLFSSGGSEIRWVEADSREVDSASLGSASGRARDGLHERSGFGFSSPRFTETSNEPGKTFVLWGDAEQTSQISWSPSSKPNLSRSLSRASQRPSKGDDVAEPPVFTNVRSDHLVRESFEARLARSVKRHQEHKSYVAQKAHDALGTPGPGHYELPEDPLRKLKTPVKSVTAATVQDKTIRAAARPLSTSRGRSVEAVAKNMIRSKSPGFSFGTSARSIVEPVRKISTRTKIRSMMGKREGVSTAAATLPPPPSSSSSSSSSSASESVEVNPPPPPAPATVSA